MSQTHKKLAKPLVFFVSTGRCGTQWLASNLARYYQDEAVVTHEPLGPYYMPSTYFRRFDQTLESVSPGIPSLEEHLRKIEEVVAKGKLYIEVGWPIYGILPALIKHYGEENIKLIHLYRHPFSCSLSFYNGAWYDLDAMERKSTGVAEVFVKYKEVHELDPVNHATFFAKDYYNRWNSMNLFEKCVFLWLEVNRFSFEIQDRFPNVKLFRVKFEDLIEKPKEDTMKALFQFLELPYKKEMLTATDTRVDTWTWTFSVNKDANQHQPAAKETKKSTSKEEIEAFKKDLLNHPLAVKLGQQLGYSIEANDDMGTNREKKSTEPLYISSSGSKLYKGDVVGAYEMSSTVSRSLPYFRTCLLIESILTLYVVSQALSSVNFDVSKLLENQTVATGIGAQLAFLIAVHFGNKGLKDLTKARKYAWALLGYFGLGWYFLSGFFSNVASAASSGALTSLDPISSAFGVTVFAHYTIGLWMLYKVLRFRFAGNSLQPPKKTQ